MPFSEIINKAKELSKVSALAYQNKDIVSKDKNYTMMSDIFDEDTDTTVYVLYDATNQNIIISWRGTESIKDWLTDSNIIKVKAFGECKIKIHRGFYEAYTSVRHRVLSSISRCLKNYKVKSIISTGHSLGGALATINIYDIAKTFDAKINLESYTFGSPRVGNIEFRDDYNKLVPTTYRFMHDMDLVPRVPKISYRHVNGMGIYIDSNGKIFKWYRKAFTRICWYFKVLISDIRGLSIKDHFIDEYIKSFENYLSNINHDREE